MNERTYNRAMTAIFVWWILVAVTMWACVLVVWQ
jgi:hypothetical protein